MVFVFSQEHEQTVTMLQNKLNSLKKAEKDRSDSEAALSREKDSQSGTELSLQRTKCRISNRRSLLLTSLFPTALQIEEKENLEREISDAKATVALLQQQLRVRILKSISKAREGSLTGLAN